MSPFAGSAGPGAQQGWYTKLYVSPESSFCIRSPLVLQTLKALVGHQVNLNLNYHGICLYTEREGELEAVWLLMASSVQGIACPFLTEHPPVV